jgi:carbonic anhydrase
MLPGHLGTWLASIRELYQENKKKVDNSGRPKELLTELNVAQQVQSLLKNQNVQDAIKGRGLQVHGWVYDVATGCCKDLKVLQNVDDCIMA